MVISQWRMECVCGLLCMERYGRTLRLLLIAGTNFSKFSGKLLNYVCANIHTAMKFT